MNTKWENTRTSNRKFWSQNFSKVLITLILFPYLGNGDINCLHFFIEEVKDKRKSTNIEDKYNFFSIVLKIHHQEGQIQNSQQKHILMSLSVGVVPCLFLQCRWGWFEDGWQGKKWRDTNSWASVSCCLPYSQTDIYLLIYEANCTPEL